MATTTKNNKNSHVTLKALPKETDNFSNIRYIGGGRFWAVYHGTLPDGREVAIKRARASSSPSRPDWETAFNSVLHALACTKHVNIVWLMGYCTDSGTCMLVYEFMANGTLHEQIHSRSPMAPAVSSWRGRLTIALDVACAIEYMHVRAVPPIIHGDVTSANILFDDAWTAKVSSSDDEASGTPRDPLNDTAGTFAYMDPDYLMTLRPTDKSDVYIFGVVLLELLTGCRAIMRRNDGEIEHVVKFAVPHIEANDIVRVLDPRLPAPMPNEAEALAYVGYIAAECVRLSSLERPSVTKVTVSLKDAIFYRGSVPLSRTATGQRSTLSSSSTDHLHFNLTDVDEDELMEI